MFVAKNEHIFIPNPPNAIIPSDTNIYNSSEEHSYIGDKLDSITGYTADYKSLNSLIFLKHNIGSLGRIETQEVCYILNGKKYCLKGRENAYYEENIETLYASFGEDNCSVYSDYVICSNSDFRVTTEADGDVDVFGRWVGMPWCFIYGYNTNDGEAHCD